MTSLHNWNQGIIDEFRANEGRVGGPFEGAPVLLLTSTGAKSGRPHTTPAVYYQEGDTIYVFASKGGASTNPDWYHNLATHRKATIEVGTEKFDVDAEVLTGAERDRVYSAQSALRPQFAAYQQNTTRTIPVVGLRRKK
jgi:deazaflavin-dependent oxidoreductase (nitroreductase family)